MTLDEEIFLFKITADETELALKRKDEMNDDYVRHLEKKAKKCRQFEEWLKELKKYKELFESPEEAEECLNGCMV